MSWPVAGETEGKSWTGRDGTWEQTSDPDYTWPHSAPPPHPHLSAGGGADPKARQGRRVWGGGGDYKWDFTNDKLWPITRGLVMETCESGGGIRQCPLRDTGNVSASLAGRLVGLAAACGQDRKWLKRGGNKAVKDTRCLLADLFTPVSLRFIVAASKLSTAEIKRCLQLTELVHEEQFFPAVWDFFGD